MTEMHDNAHHVDLIHVQVYLQILYIIHFYRDNIDFISLNNTFTRMQACHTKTSTFIHDRSQHGVR